MDGQQPDTTVIKLKSKAPDLQSKEFISLIKDAMGFGTEPDDQDVVDAKAALAIDALKKQILIERCQESLHQNGWKSGDIKSVDTYKVLSCPEEPGMCETTHIYFHALRDFRLCAVCRISVRHHRGCIQEGVSHLKDDCEHL